jgi:predicted transglutaminase-like cysteine proteinase
MCAVNVKVTLPGNRLYRVHSLALGSMPIRSDYARLCMAVASIAALVLWPVVATAAPATDIAPLLEAPRGYSEMCKRDKALCNSFAPRTGRAERSADEIARLNVNQSPTSKKTDAGRVLRSANAGSVSDIRQLRRINSSVNRFVIQQTDDRTYKSSEYWARSGLGPAAHGDCEDIAIEKRLQLIDAGIRPDRMAFAVVYSHMAGLHVLLLVRMPSGIIALDSRSNRVGEVGKLKYRWVVIQDWRKPTQWHPPKYLAQGHNLVGPEMASTGGPADRDLQDLSELTPLKALEASSSVERSIDFVEAVKPPLYFSGLYGLGQAIGRAACLLVNEEV